MLAATPGRRRLRVQPVVAAMRERAEFLLVISARPESKFSPPIVPRNPAKSADDGEGVVQIDHLPARPDHRQRELKVTVTITGNVRLQVFPAKTRAGRGACQHVNSPWRSGRRAIPAALDRQARGRAGDDAGKDVRQAGGSFRFGSDTITVIAAPRGGRQHDELLRPRDAGQRRTSTACIQQNTVIRANAQREREDRHRREGWALHKHPQSETKVLHVDSSSGCRAQATHSPRGGRGCASL